MAGAKRFARRKSKPVIAKERQAPEIRATLYLICGLIAAFLIWASSAQLEEIARGTGRVIPVSKTQIIQSSEPGIVQEILVQVGQTVKKGDMLLRLDDTMTASSLGEAEAKARSLSAQIARLDIEQSGNFDAAYACPEDVASIAPEVCLNEASLLKARADNFNNQMDVLKERLQQRVKELSEAQENISRLQENLKISQQEETLLGPLVQRKLAAQTDLLKIRKEVSDTQGQIKQLKETVDRVQAAGNEAKLQLNELKLQAQQEALATKTDALSQLSVLKQTIKGAESRVTNTDIRSPVDGIINTLDVNTVGAYVNAGAVVAGIVPTSDKLLIEARLSPSDVAFVRPGQPATIKISAYDFTIYGGLQGTVQTVSADSIVDQQKGESYYLVRIGTDTAALTKDGKSYPISPGMIATADIVTGKKTVLAYLLKPLIKAQREAMRER